jgi:hypothetical protein
LIVQLPEVLLAIAGPIPVPLLCHLHLLAKNVFTIVYTLQIGAMSVTRYIYVFIFKNPSGKNDDFWCFFFNFAAGILSLLSQIVFQHLPGKNPYLYYLCCNLNPPSSKKPKLNVPLQATFVLTFLVYLYVLVKVNVVRRKHFLNEANDNNAAREKVKSAVSKFGILALILATLVPVPILSSMLNSVDPQKLGKYPFYHLIQAHLHLLPFLCIVMQTTSVFLSSKKLRISLWRDLMSLFKPDLLTTSTLANP